MSVVHLFVIGACYVEVGHGREFHKKKDMQPYVKTAYLSWYTIGESNTVESIPGPLQEGGLSHAAHECIIKRNKTHNKAKAIVLQKKP